MDMVKWAEKLMSMDEQSWSRHANPWSVYSRFSIMPMLSLAIWSREWVGYHCLVFILLCVLWVWLNPRLFSPPKDHNNWASKGTFGERLYLDRANQSLPAHHLVMAKALQWGSAIGLVFFIYGLWVLDIWVVILGNVWVMVFKAWFVDRMVWLYQDVKANKQ
ncbi:DUF6653 family protein [Marinomonas sp. TW1]|uniref:DUF6653 family protein n=1 Tax=Marinomonas sp. TW1 TaxID=1561203 RepID=UPI0007AF6903|nr:DUF6653 family protein [Marinomonas sp. TW1]KZN14734.1 hypothetical protein OA79_03225 [Marinomonas sp. TW1]